MVKNIFLIYFYCSILYGCESKQGNAEAKSIHCNSYIDDAEVIKVDLDQIDLSNISSIIKYEETLYLTQPFSGLVISYNLSNEKSGSIGGIGRGPNEFLNAKLYHREDILYIQGLNLAKISEFNMNTLSFQEEYLLDKVISGPLISVSTESDRKLFYFASHRRDRRVSNNTYIDIIQYDSGLSRYDTIMTYQDLGRLNYWDSSRNADYSFEALMYKHTIVGELEGRLVSIDTDQFSFSFINELNSSIAIEYNYKPEYQSYIQGVIEEIPERNRSFPALEIDAFKSAIKKDSRPFGSLFKKWISNDSHVLFSLFGSNNAHIVYSLEREGEPHVVCSSKDYDPILIDKGSIYWVAKKGNYEFELVRTKI